MAHSPFPEDRPDPNENMPAMRARVPEHVHRGVFSTGAIVMTGATEFIIDFVQNLGRPHQIVARIVIPHMVMPQFADALAKNIDLYRQRFGPLPTPNIPGQTPTNPPPAPEPPPVPNPSSSETSLASDSHLAAGFVEPSTKESHAPAAAAGSSGKGSGSSSSESPNKPAPSAPVPPQAPPAPPPRKPTAQEIYDELKLRDELLSGSYANAVMIGHGPHEFSFDFITNFYPQSAVSCRVFVAAGQVERLQESLKSSWEQLRPRA